MNTAIKKLLSGLLFYIFCLSAYAVDQPTIMVLPDNTWLRKNGFGTYEVKQGQKRFVPNYDEAFIESAELRDVIATVEKIFSDRGYDIISSEAAYNQQYDEANEDQFIESEEDGGSLEEVFLDVKPDYKLYVGWNVDTSLGEDRCLTFIIQVIDSYSSKSVATANGTSDVFKRNVPIVPILEHSVLNKIDYMLSQLNKHRRDVLAKGREIRLRIRFWPNSGLSMSSEFGGKELTTIINNWISDNSVGHKFEKTQSDKLTNKEVRYFIRIPLKDANGRPVQTEQYVDQLREYLKNTYSIRSANRSTGLGGGYLIIGSK